MRKATMDLKGDSTFTFCEEFVAPLPLIKRMKLVFYYQWLFWGMNQVDILLGYFLAFRTPEHSLINEV